MLVCVQLGQVYMVRAGSRKIHMATAGKAITGRRIGHQSENQ